MRTVMNKNTIGTILALILMILAIAPGGFAYDYHYRWHRYWHPYHHVSTTKGALIGGAGGAAVGALAGGGKGALIGGAIGAGSGYLVQRYRNHHRAYHYYTYR